MKNAISVWMCQIIAARCRKRNIGAISGLYRGYLEHCMLAEELEGIIEFEGDDRVIIPEGEVKEGCNE